MNLSPYFLTNLIKFSLKKFHKTFYLFAFLTNLINFFSIKKVKLEKFIIQTQIFFEKIRLGLDVQTKFMIKFLLLKIV